MPNGSEYKKTFADELDWKLFDQLHQVVSQISGFCFQTKQFCVTVEIAVLGILVKFTHDNLDHSIFITGIVIPLCFWVLDSVAYFYQVKLRGMMETIRTRLQSRNEIQLINNATVRIIEQERVYGEWQSRVAQSLFNNSMWLYMILFVIDPANPNSRFPFSFERLWRRRLMIGGWARNDKRNGQRNSPSLY